MGFLPILMVAVWWRASGTSFRDFNELLATARATHDAHRRGWHRKEVRNQAADGVVGLALDRSGVGPHFERAVVELADLIATGAGVDADRDTDGPRP